MQLVISLMAHDEFLWLCHAQDVLKKYMGCADPEGSGSETVEQLGEHPNECSCTTQRTVVLLNGETVWYITSCAAAGGSNPMQLPTEAGTKLKLEWLWILDIGVAHRGHVICKSKSKKKDPVTN